MFSLDGFRPDAMDALVGPIFHVSIILGIFYAWTIGFNQESKFRPGKSRNMKEEFLVLRTSTLVHVCNRHCQDNFVRSFDIRLLLSCIC